MDIYRIEHENGYGIFMATDNEGSPYYLNMGKRFINRHENFPLPDEDMGILRYTQHDEYCAFKSKSDLQKWISKREMQAFSEMGFDAWRIEVDAADVVIGEYQILYKKDKIKSKVCITSEVI